MCIFTVKNIPIINRTKITLCFQKRIKFGKKLKKGMTFICLNMHLL